jgi:DNA-directed RNA polymerase alpha subunit
VTLSTLGVVSAPYPAAAAAITPEAARDQWKRALTTIDDLSDNWATISQGGGDAIRTRIGTQGTTSPLFQIDKVLKILREDAEDFIEFQETADEFQLALSRTDAMAYSANFAGGAGKPTPPAVYIEKAKTETIELRRIAKALNALI